MLVFDKWTCNTDGRQAVFVSRRSQYEAVFIDHGECFGSARWALQSYPRSGLSHVQNVYATVRGMESFEPWLARVDAIDANALWRGFETMPEEWYFGDSLAAHRLVETLLERKRALPDVLLELAGGLSQLFPA